MGVGAEATSSRSHSCGTIELFLEKKHRGGLLRGVSIVVHWPVEEQDPGSRSTAAITTTGEQPEVGGSSSGLPSPLCQTGILGPVKHMGSCEKNKSEKTNEEADSE